MEKVLEVSHLSKQYGKKTAVNNISFSIEKGQVFGLLGPNGSGKTTTLSSILTLLSPSSGTIKVFGSENLTAALKQCGVLLESASYYPDLSAVANLKISCSIKGVSYDKIDAALERVGLTDDKNYKVKTFSLGMKQRLNVASALLNDPQFLVFDEPTNGLDPIGIAEMRQILLDLAKEGRTILIASHLLNEMEKICSHVAILKKGEIIEQGEIGDLMKGHESLEAYFLNITA